MPRRSVHLLLSAWLVFTAPWLAAASSADELLTELVQADAERRPALLGEHFRASQVSWPAGTTSLVDGIRHLSSNQANVLLELGINESRSVELPAFSGDWWAGVQLICQHFDLEPVPVADAPVTDRRRPHYELDDGDEGNLLQGLLGGSLLLRPRQATAAAVANAACGPVLVNFTDITLTEIRRLQGSARSVDLAWQLRLEPSLRHDLVKHAKLTWTAAEDQDGRELTLPQGTADEDLLLRTLRGGSPDQQARRVLAFDPRDEQPIYPSTTSARITGLQNASERLRLAGELELSCQTRLTAHAEIGIDEQVTFPDCPVPVQAELRRNPNARIRKRFPHQLDISYDSDDLPTPPQITIVGPDGIGLDSFAQNHETRNGASVITMYLSNVQPGKHRVTIRTAIALGTVTLPVACEVALP